LIPSFIGHLIISYEEFVVERYKMTCVRYSYSGYNKGLASCLAMLIYAMFFTVLIVTHLFLWGRPIKNNVTKLPPALNIA